ncbi:hypothetical protein PV516_19610 [Streptomyces scabiei]|uniref:hypothetical protein n=1 Tax=Streptomyces scabiei TaxID=1930 RepID=UPI0029BCA226|nr:hypothetical protein [Streptomyces scabiei]MDX3165998.1 hypothetical protein [Streptomyces scabiei]
MAEPVQNEPPLFVPDLVRTLDAARNVVSGLGDDESSDVSVSALAALVCTGESPADALQAAADAVRRSPTLEPHGLSLTRTPGLVAGTWEWILTMTISTREPLPGEHGGQPFGDNPVSGEQ